MQRPLDPLSFKKNPYERPNQKWICGRAAEGHSCPLGPDARGNCRATGECIPAKKGDRWLCTRSEAQGDKCEDGPLPDGACAHPVPPCQPVRSLRHARGMFVGLALALTAGALLIVLGEHFRHRWMNPGTLTNAHATSATRCADCHGLDSQLAETKLASNSLGQRGLNDSTLCLKCHQLGEQPLHPHGLSPAALDQVRKTLSPKSGSQRPPIFLRVSQTLVEHDSRSGDLACAACHQEHHGRTFNLRQMSNAQCQVCHTVQFASFRKGHPEFAGYPYQRRTRIFFDHISHLQQHFKEAKTAAPQGCQDCHAPGPAGRFMQVKNFNTTCASCHSAQIKGEGMTTKGVAFFSVPGIDAETLAAKGLSIGEWPKFADARLTPFMELLLDGQPKARAALEQLRGADLLDLTKATPEQLTAAERYAWEVKRLLFHLVIDGQSYLLEEMKDKVAPAGLEIPRATILAAQKEWMPHLSNEMANYEKGIRPPLPARATPTQTPTPAAKAPAGGDESLLGGDDLTTAATPAPKDDGDLLAGGNDDLTAAAIPSPSTAPGGDDLTNGDLQSAAPAASPEPSATPTAAPAPEPKSAEEWVAAGGWYRPKESFTLFYRPVGHADPFLVAWIVAAAHERNTDAQTSDAFARLTDRQNPGLCMKCHTVDETAGALQINWQPEQPAMTNRPFTTFSHTKHFSLVGDAGCQTCHALNAQAEYAKSFIAAPNAEAPRDPLHFQSNFRPVAKTLCADCHQPRVAGDSCTLCHRYHAAPVARGLAEVGRFRPISGKK